jgi:hypothetical protein
MRLSFIAAVAIVLAAAWTSAAGPAKPQQTSVESGVSIVSTGDYKPIEPQSLDEIPQDVRERLQTHLLDRLGKDYLASLTFAGGQIVDFDRLYVEEPNAKNYKWTVFAYRLLFRLAAPDKGITEYVAAIELDKNGGVIKEIELPPVRRSPLKANFISLTKAYATAAAHRFDVQQTSAELIYDRVTESIAYRLRQTVAYRSPTGTDRVIEIDAHSGRVLRVFESSWIE